MEEMKYTLDAAKAEERLHWAGVLKQWIWDKNIRLERTGPQAIVFAVIAAVALAVELSYHQGALSLREALSAQSVVIFYNVKAVLLSSVDASIGSWIIAISFARILFGLVVGIADMVFYEKITGRPFDWNAMVTISAVNVVFLLTAVFTFMNPAVTDLLVQYERLIQHVPTLVNLNGALALVVAALIGDFCFYWSHRWCHKVRFFWNLGHVNHHRSKNLSQLTQAVDPQSFFLDTAGGKVFVLLLLPVMTKLFTLDFRDSGWALIVLLVLDVWTNPSHSVVLYYAENRSRVLRWFRWFLVTPAVHFTHHSREPEHNLTDGCNFGARVTLWDRLLGTYVEPPPRIPEAGLFSEETDYCNNPVRFIFHPYVRMFTELRQNELKYWPAILFGPTTYDPPVPVKSKH
ncbi:sterol desaturase family protein [Cystobacter fuscus]|uniref:sterol desaturase family protein n=1 Tax=Cystobacter fuscus TaxID=43 RepID=UPI002B2F03E6|nr:sterol desaturase family protein [Cystobacter fuscus]